MIRLYEALRLFTKLIPAGRHWVRKRMSVRFLWLCFHLNWLELTDGWILWIRCRSYEVTYIRVVLLTDVFHQFITWEETSLGQNRKRFRVGSRVLNRDVPLKS